MDPTTINAICGIFSGIMALAAATIYYRNESCRKTLKNLQEFTNHLITTVFVNTHVFVLGPRTAGKTSIAASWIRIWMNISRMPPTPLDFIEHRYEFPEYFDESEYRHELGITITKRTKALATVYDYAGEDSALDSAVEKIASEEHYIVVFVITCEPMKERINAEYFNVSFLKKMRNALTKSDCPPPPCFVLFNKIDLVDRTTCDTDEKLLAACQEKNETALHNIISVFGTPHTHCVSAESGEGTAPFLRALSSYIVETNGHPKRIPE